MVAGWALVNELLMIISAVIVSFGWYHIRRKNVDMHRRLMKTGAGFGAAFFISYLLQTIFAGDASFGGPSGLAGSYQVFLQTHVLLATVAAVLGIITLRFALRQNFVRHRKVAPTTAVLWLIAAATGLVVYVMLFVIFKPGAYTSNLINVLLGR